MLQGCTVGILGVYMHFHSSAELTCPWMSSSTQDTARLWMPPPHEEEHAVHGVASHLQKQGESSGQTHTLPTPSVSFPTTTPQCPSGQSASERLSSREPKASDCQGLLSQRGFSAGKSALLTLKLYINVRNYSAHCVQGYLWGPSPTQKRAVQYFSL